MKIQLIFILMFSLSLCLLPNDEETITFSQNGIHSTGDGAKISGTEVKLQKSKTYILTGIKDEGNIVVQSSDAVLILQNLILSSKVTAPITVNSNLNNVQIITKANSSLIDLEDYATILGEKSAIKIKKNSIVYLENEDILYLTGNCSNAIKSTFNSSIIFQKSKGKYIIYSYKASISAESYLEFNGGNFEITSNGDAIVADPDTGDTIGLGKILIKNGNFYIRCKGDAFTAYKNITIIDGIFNIKTENGFDSETFDPDNDSAKGFKVKENETKSEMIVINSDMEINAADDAFHSNGDLTIKKGKYIIHSKDDGVHAGYNLVLGEKDAPNTNLNLSVFYSYEALEAMTITIYSGKIIATASDDGINAAGGGSDDVPPGPGPGPHPGPRQNENEKMGQDETDIPPGPDPGPGPSPGPRPGPGGRGNASYYISIYTAEVYVFCDGDGLDTNGNIFIHGGKVTVFSQGNRDNEPIDHDGNFTLFNGEILCVGSRGMEPVHEGIKKGNGMYAYYANDITKNKFLKIVNEKGNIIREEYINKDINYIFYSSLELNNNYNFYLVEDGVQSKLSVNISKPAEGEDDEDVHGGGGDSENIGKYLCNSIIAFCLLLILF